MILPQERHVILELSHVILDHTHQGMHIYPTAMTATLLLQYDSSGLTRGKPLVIISSAHPISPSVCVYRGVDGEVGMAEGTGPTEGLQDTLGGRYVSL